jgi:membrane-associated phospholipid phosphatase
MALYGVCVAIATVYGRYHYAVDVLAGAALSFLGLLLAYLKSRGA